MWGGDLAEMQLISKYNKDFRFLLCVIDLFSKRALGKGEKDAKITDALQSILHDLGRKPDKIWVDHGSKFYSKSFRTWLDDNDIKIYSTHNEGKSVVPERFIRTLKQDLQAHNSCVKKTFILTC